MSNQAQCAHTKIEHVFTEHPGGTYSEEWRCKDCQTNFWPDVAKVKLRDEFASKALIGLFCCEANPQVGTQIEPFTVKHSDGMAEAAYIVADAMLKARLK